MSFSAGVFSINSTGQPVVTGTVISSTVFNALTADLATGLTTCMLKDGTQTITANIPMSNFKITGLGAATAVADVPQTSQVQNGAFIYLTSPAGTNTVTATAAPIPSAYAAGQTFRFIPANTNTGATTLNVSSLGAKDVFAFGAACAGGELVQNVPAEVMYDGTQFNIINPQAPTLNTTIGSDVSLNNTANFFTVLAVAQGQVGTWYASGSIIVADNVGAQFNVKLWDGTTVIASANISTAAADQVLQCALSGFITNPAGNIRISAQDITSTNGIVYYNKSGSSRDATLTAIRIG